MVTIDASLVLSPLRQRRSACPPTRHGVIQWRRMDRVRVAPAGEYFFIFFSHCLVHSLFKKESSPQSHFATAPSLLSRSAREVRRLLAVNLLSNLRCRCGRGHKSSPLRRLDLTATLTRNTSAVVECRTGLSSLQVTWGIHKCDSLKCFN